ncbi:MAG: FtsX-like permease family protein [Gemmatimonas sp.]|nr:FtsX-like permease family protein [Gemmatimonas sp.]
MSERFAGIRRVFRLGKWRRELDDELAFHHESTVADLVRSGLSPAEAEAEARRRFGEAERYRRELETIDRRKAWIESLDRRVDIAFASVRYAFRRLSRAPLFSAGIIATFGLGIGGNAVMFTILDRTLFSPPAHVLEPEQVRRLMIDEIAFTSASRQVADEIRNLDFVELSRIPAFASVAAVAKSTISLNEGPDELMGQGQAVSGNFFEFLRVRPALGSFFGQEDDRVGGQPLAVISYSLWQSQFGADPGVVGRILDFGLGPYTVVGVAPQGFTGVDLRRIDVWLPMRVAGVQLMDGETDCFEGRLCIAVQVLTRLASNYSESQADAQATAYLRADRAENPPIPGYPADLESRAVLAPLQISRGPLAPEESRLALWLAGISLIVLIVACSNIANLLISRHVCERRESAIRLAIGSSRSRLVGQVLLESSILAAFGGLAALLVATWGGSIFGALLLPDVEWSVPGSVARTVTLTLLLALIAGLFAAMLPAWQFLRTSAGEVLKDGGRTMSPWSTRVRGSLTALQAALSVVLLVGAGLFARSFGNVRSLDLGIEPDRVLLATPSFSDGITQGEDDQLLAEAMERLQRLPGVETASRDIGAPFGAAQYILRVIPVDGDTLPAGLEPRLHYVDQDYFATMGLQVRHGRGFGREHTATGPGAVVVSESMARVMWGEENPIGRCLQAPMIAGPCIEVIGVVEDSRETSLDGTQPLHFYRPAEQKRVTPRFRVILLKTAGPPIEIVPDVRGILTELDPANQSAEILPLSTYFGPLTRTWRLGATVFSIFGMLALIVAGIGLYSALAYGVTQRRFELGIRAALGARRKQLLSIVVREVVGLASIGVLAGLTCAYLLAPRIDALLFDVAPRDPLTLASVAFALLLVGILASTIPAFRAVRVDPAVVLRAD